MGSSVIQRRDFLIPYAYGMLFGAFLALAVAFVAAYMSPLKRVTIYIDLFGEANIEMVLVLFMIFFCSYTGVVIILGVRRKVYARRILQRLKIDYFD